MRSLRDASGILLGGDGKRPTTGDDHEERVRRNACDGSYENTKTILIRASVTPRPDALQGSAHRFQGRGDAEQEGSRRLSSSKGLSKAQAAGRALGSRKRVAIGIC